MRISDVSIEITRMCNMNCWHCLRGEPRRKHISYNYLEMFFSKVKEIDFLTITGGEPSLNSVGINEITFLIKEKGVSINNFHITTNGKYISDGFMKSIINLYLVCQDNKFSSLMLSNDIYHEKISDENIKKLKIFSFFSNKYSKGYEEYKPINEGRAKSNVEGKNNSIEKFEIEDDRIIEGNVYLNCKGNIIAGCDWSYESQELDKHFVCKVSDMKIEEFEKYNSKVQKYYTGKNKTWVESC
jgi:organic radical activating enzyme